MSERFQKSAVGALSFLTHLLEQAEQDSSRIASPQILEMLTLCRETGLRLPILDVFSKVCDDAPVFALLGGDAMLAAELANCMGLKATPRDVAETPIVWWFEPGKVARVVVQMGTAEQELSEAALNALLSSALPPDRVTVLRKTVESDSIWRFVWLPDVESLNLHVGSSAMLEALVGSQIVIFIGDDSPVAFQPWLSRPGIIAKQYSATEIVRNDIRPTLLKELTAMREQSYDEQQAVHAATWQFLMPRVVDQLDALRQQYSIEIDRQNMKLQTTRQTLGEYRRNWSGGMRNIMDEYFTKKVTGTAMASLLDPKQAGPQTSSYLQALSLQTFWKKLHELLNDRMAEFVQGLSALANRVELRTISMKELDMRWNPASLAQQIEEELETKRVFADGGGERSGLVGSFMGKKDEIVGNRRSQIGRANKVVQQIIEQDFLQWSDRVFHAVEQRVRVQIAAAQVNQGLPDIETLRTSLTGIDRLTEMLEGNREGVREEPPKRIGQLLKSWGQRRWFRRYASAA